MWSQVRALAVRAASVFHRSTLDARVAEEIEHHLALEAAENARRGLTPSAARTDALRDFGGVAQTREAYHAASGFAWLDALRQDLLYALRTLRKSPGFALSAVVILALATGVNTALFTFFDGYVLKPIPIPDASRNFEVYPKLVRQGQFGVWSYPDFRQIAASNSVFSQTYAYQYRDLRILDPDARTAHVCFISGNYTGVFGGKAMLGRPLLPSDDEAPDRDAVIMLSENGWRRLFHSNAAIVGRHVQIRQRDFAIIGVADSTLADRLRFRRTCGYRWPWQTKPFPAARPQTLRSTVSRTVGLAWEAY